MRSTPAVCARLALAAVLAGCASNAAPLPAEDAPAVGTGEVRAARRGGASAPEAGEANATDHAGPDAATAPAPADDGAGAASSFRGEVEGHTLAPTHNFFVRGALQVAGEPEVLILVQTDHPDLCAHLGAGTMPRNATMFALALMREDGGPLPAQGKFVAPYDRGPVAPLHAMAYFRHLDEDCVVSPLPSATGAEAQYGSVQLLPSQDATRARVRYSLTMNTEDVVEGEVDATVCDAPALVDQPTTLMLAEVDPDACR